jgi:hypothetical protein
MTIQDVLLRFDSQTQAAQIGQELGYSTQDPETGEWQTTQATLDLAICVIGEHYAPTGETTEGPSGELVPVMAGDGKWWVMVRSLVEIELPAQILPFIVERDPENPAIPNQVWA